MNLIDYLNTLLREKEIEVYKDSEIVSEVSESEEPVTVKFYQSLEIVPKDRAFLIRIPPIPLEVLREMPYYDKIRINPELFMRVLEKIIRNDMEKITGIPSWSVKIVYPRIKNLRELEKGVVIKVIPPEVEFTSPKLLGLKGFGYLKDLEEFKFTPPKRGEVLAEIIGEF